MIVQLTKGQHLVLSMSVRDQNDNKVDISDYTIAGSIKDRTLTANTLTSLVIAVTSAANGTFTASANAAVTADLPEGRHPAIVRFTRTNDGALIGDNTFEIVVKRALEL